MTSCLAELARAERERKLAELEGKGELVEA